MNEQFHITTIEVNSDFISCFGVKSFDSFEMGKMILTDRISAENFRLRESQAPYVSDWHVAGDPTLIIIQQGCLKISLRNGSFKEFKSGDMFIAEDYLPQDITFDESHGHKAEIVGSETLKAVHIKLSVRK